MHKIDDPTATPDNQFTAGDPANGVPATIVTADWLNAVQGELVNTIEGAGLTLNKPDNTQLKQAIELIAASYGSNGLLVSPNDSTDGYLNGKLVAGTRVSLTELNDGSDETLRIDVTDIDEATQAEMEAATITNKAATPGTTQYHPGVGKAWVAFNGTGTVSIGASYNVSSITDNGVGDYTINFITPFSSGNYVWAGACPVAATDRVGHVAQKLGTLPAADSCPIEVVSDIAGQNWDANYVSFIALGDQA